MRSSVSVLLAASVALAGLAWPRTAAAQPPDPGLLARLAQHVAAIHDLGKRASLRLDELTEELDGDGKVSSTKTEVAHVETDGKTSHEIVERATKDGKDVTAEEQERAKKEEAEAAGKKGKEDEELLTIPFSAAAADIYNYDQVATDAADSNRVEIAFTPKKPTKHTVEGKAWVDTTNGTVISAGVKLSKPPTFVDWVHFTIELGAKTPLGPALSRLTFEGKGGILFVRKHFRGEIKMSDYRVAP